MRPCLSQRIAEAALIAGLAATMLPAVSASAAPPTADDVRRCQQLQGKNLGGALISEAEMIEGGDTLARRFIFFSVSVPRNVCRVRATASPVSSSSINVEVWLPEGWNGKMLGTGGGGMNGGLDSSTKEHAVGIGSGYAGVINDLGHDLWATAGKWGYQQPEKVIDFGHRGNHVAAVAGKAIIEAYYGKPPARSYFQGCSGGGREALMLAQRYPEDYDGIIAGAPAADFTGLMTAGLWNSQHVTRHPGAKKLSDKLELLRRASVDKCDKRDGVADGIIENPLTCDFDPGELACQPGQRNDKCLNEAEIAAAREIYGDHVTAGGAMVMAGHVAGSEENWEPFITSGGIGASMLTVPFHKWIVAQDPDFSPDGFNMDKGYALAKSKVGSIVDAVNPDLTAFSQRGGKLLIYHGWEDGAIPARATLDYYTAVKRQMGVAADDSVRLFLMPGVSHCEGGQGPSLFDKLGVLERWAEQGQVPDHILASKYEDDDRAKEGRPTKLVKTRPVCAWPGTATYKGQGSVDAAVNFACTGDTD